MANLSLGTLLIFIAGGILPAIVWLWFWLKEDAARPEPRRIIIGTFIAGGIATIPAFILEKYARDILGVSTGASLFLVWALIEETVKYGAALCTAERTKSYDEPIDSMIYLMTAALGFAACENLFFLVDHNIDGSAFHDILLGGNLRFLGANILHPIASGIAGGIIALTFYRGTAERVYATILGLITATALHTIFNLLIIRSSGGEILTTFAYFWIVAALVILLFERVKRIRPYYV